MPDDPSEAVETTQEPQPSAGEPPRHYVNAVHAQGGPWDLQLSFGQQTPPKDPEWNVSLLMSWEHAKALLTVLEQFVSNFERDIGEIPMPDLGKEIQVRVREGGQQ